MLAMEARVEVRVLAKQGMSARAIARVTGLSRNTVAKVLAAPEARPVYGPRRPVPSLLDPFKEYLRTRMAAAAPEAIPATVLHREVVERGFTGGYETVKRFVRAARPKPAPEPVVRFETEPGVQVQFDWAVVRRGADRLSALIVTLGWSRAAYVRFFAEENCEALIEGLTGAFDYFGGVARIALTDNMKAVVLERDAFGPGRHRFNPAFLDFSAHCGFTTQLCKPRRARTKGKVERFVRYLRGSFLVPLEARFRPEGVIVDAEIANGAIGRWLEEVANARVHATTKAVPAERLALERASLLPKPPPWRGQIAPARPAKRRLASPTVRAASLQRALADYDALITPAP